MKDLADFDKDIRRSYDLLIDFHADWHLGCKRYKSGMIGLTIMDGLQGSELNDPEQLRRLRDWLVTNVR